MKPASFKELLREALQFFSANGYTSEADLQDWLLRLHRALEQELPSDDATRRELASILATIYKREVDRSGVIKRVPGVSRYTLDRISPTLRAELDRRIFAGVDLIKLNRAEAVQKTLKRFSGWTSSVPKGGSPTTDLRAVATEIGKPTAELKFQRRRVAVDQGHKLSAAISHVVAMGNGAIAGIWHDRGEQDHGYDARPEHLARSGTTFLVRDSWGMTEGLMKKAGLTYYDEIDQVAQLPFCSCYMTWIVSPRELPPENLTAKGRAWVDGRGWVAGIGPQSARQDSTVRMDPALAAADVDLNPTDAQRESGPTTARATFASKGSTSRSRLRRTPFEAALPPRANFGRSS